jgi:hypothetical protein
MLNVACVRIVMSSFTRFSARVCVNGKVVPLHAIKAYGGVEVQLLSLLTLGVGRVPGTH